MSSTALQSLSPGDAVEWYVEDRRDELRTQTLRKHRSALNCFLDWTDEAAIDDMNEIGGRELMRFKTWRKNEASLKTISLNGNLSILRVFLRFCANIEAVAADVPAKVPVPNVPERDAVNEWVPPEEDVGALRNYLEKFEYASRQHLETELVAEIGLRLGAVRAIDLQDVQMDESVIELRHRPEGTDVLGTPLKNGTDGQRLVNMSRGLSELLEDYVETNRRESVDSVGRDPLLTTAAGRPSTATIRRDFYKFTRPCVFSNGCPHDRNVTTCEATANSNASGCPSSYSTHPLRKWSIMNQLDEGLPKEILSDRADVSVPVLDKHYDQRSEERKSQRRRKSLQDHLPEY